MRKAEVELLLKRFVRRMKKDYKNNLVFIVHHGSWATGEAKPDSDVDFLIGLKKIGHKDLIKLRRILKEKEFQKATVLFFSLLDMENYIPYGRHQFHYGAKLLYGKCPLSLPTKDQEISEIKKHVDEIGFWGRYLFTHQHPRDRMVRSIYWRLKEVIICLKVYVSLKTGKYPTTREELKKSLNDKEDKELVQISEKWKKHKPEFVKNPDPVLLKLADFSQRILKKLNRLTSKTRK
ncbi:MAG: nucleotidyltransferase domain-containing protein [Candidatus Zixiibacteriota bacterium]